MGGVEQASPVYAQCLSPLDSLHPGASIRNNGYMQQVYWWTSLRIRYPQIPSTEHHVSCLAVVLSNRLNAFSWVVTHNYKGIFFYSEVCALVELPPLRRMFFRALCGQRAA